MSFRYRQQSQSPSSVHSNIVSRPRAGRCLVFGLLLSLALVVVPLTRLAPSASANSPNCTYYQATGHNLCGEFAEYWNAFGGLAVYGYPITEAQTDPTTGLLTQWFERARFELHTGADPAHFNVELGLLGVTVGAQDPNRAPFQPTAKRDAAGCVYFAATKQNLCGGFYAYWKKFGGLAVYGMPISREFQENGVTVQYFERQRFEWHPGAWPARFNVELGLLGTELHGEESPATPPAPTKPAVTAAQRAYLATLSNELSILNDSISRYETLVGELNYDSSLVFNSVWQTAVANEFEIWENASDIAALQTAPLGLEAVNAKWQESASDLSKAATDIALGIEDLNVQMIYDGDSWISQATSDFTDLGTLLAQFRTAHQS